MNNWIPMLLNINRGQNMLRMFGRKKNNNRGMIWASLLGLGVSAAAYGLRRNRNNEGQSPIQNVMNNFQKRSGGQMPNTAITEFSKELLSDKNSLTNK